MTLVGPANQNMSQTLGGGLEVGWLVGCCSGKGCWMTYGAGVGPELIPNMGSARATSLIFPPINDELGERLMRFDKAWSP